MFGNLQCRRLKRHGGGDGGCEVRVEATDSLTGDRHVLRRTAEEVQTQNSQLRVVCSMSRVSKARAKSTLTPTGKRPRRNSARLNSPGFSALAITSRSSRDRVVVPDELRGARSPRSPIGMALDPPLHPCSTPHSPAGQLHFGAWEVGVCVRYLDSSLSGYVEQLGQLGDAYQMVGHSRSLGDNS